MQEERLVLMAIGVFAVYTVTNQARHEGRFDQEEALNALGQACKEAVIGHQKSIKILRGVWVSPKEKNIDSDKGKGRKGKGRGKGKGGRKRGENKGKGRNN